MIRLFSGGLGDRHQLETELFRPLGQGLDDPLAIAFLVVGLTLIDILFARNYSASPNL